MVFLFLIAVFMLVLLVVLYVPGGFRQEMEEVSAWVESRGPFLFFTLMALLPLAGIPITPFYLTAGAVFEPVVSLPGTALALILNHLAAFVLGRGTLRPLLAFLLRKTGFQLSEPGKAGSLSTALVLKLTPGPPMFLRNYLMAMAGIPLWIFLLVSWPLSLAYAVPAVLLGDSAVEGRSGMAGIALLILLGVGLLTYFLRLRMLKRKPPSENLT
ncbi:MAG: TVP38/TMEM64 family protein [bacterium]